jgi:hypothetical protein
MSTISRDGMAQGCQSMKKLFITDGRELDFQKELPMVCQALVVT